MYRQSPNRNQRSKGIKVKRVLQICLLLAVCFWLIYQVKHSHDKKKEFDESDAKASLSRGSSESFIKLGRKDIHPGVEEATTKNVKHDEAAEEEETTGEDIEENKVEEDEPEDKKVEEKEDEGMGNGDDEIDEQGQDKLDTEIDREEGFVDYEKERGDGYENENENEEKNSEDGSGQMEKESSVEETDHDGDDTDTHEAREEHYKADDASSAVTHDTQMVGTDQENEHDENLNKQPENILEQEYKENNGEETDKGEKRKELEVEGGEMATDEKQSNVTNSETKENTLDDSENDSSPNNRVTEGSNDHSETDNSSTEVTAENHNVSLPNVTESESELGHGQEILTEGTSLEGSNLQTIDIEQAKNSTLHVDDDNHFGSNLRGPDETKDAESNSEKLSESSNNTESSTEKNDAIEAEKSDINDSADEILVSENTKNPEEIQQDSIDLSDSSNSLEEKDIHTDLDTLPEIQTEGTNNEDAAAE